jgi:hypothetical protein
MIPDGEDGLVSVPPLCAACDVLILILNAGQIAHYMKTYKLRYGFWTNYNETVFLKQEKSAQGDWLLRVSNIIKYNTKSDLNRKPNDDLSGCVSLRECMLFFMSVSSGPDAHVYVDNNDEGFIKKDSRKSKPIEGQVKPKTARRLEQPTGPPQEELEARKKKAEQERRERAMKRGNRPQVSQRPLDSLVETSRDPSARQLIPSSQPTERIGRDPSTSSSGSSRSAERGRTSRHDPSEETPGEATRQKSKSAKGVPSAESQGKQRAKSSSASRESRAQMAPPPLRAPGLPRERSSSSRRRIGPPTDQDEEEYDDANDDDLYENPDPERRSARTLPFRTSREAPPTLPDVPPQPRAPGVSPPRQVQASTQVATSTGPATATTGSAQAGGGGHRSPLKEKYDTVRTKLGLGSKDKKDKKDADKENKKGRKR